jgi:hypothetical protein
MFVDEEGMGDCGKAGRIVRVDQRRKGHAELVVVELGRLDPLGVEREANDGEARLAMEKRPAMRRDPRSLACTLEINLRRR